jgi:sec-independent protein translocase protein TatB
MDFLGIGPLEIALVALIAFIVLGPDRIPEVMRQLGKWTRQLREFTNNITRDYGSDIQQLTGEISALQEEFRSIQREITQVATGFMTTTLPTDPNNSIAPQTTPPAEPIVPQPPDAVSSIDQSLIDDVKRANTPPAASAEPIEPPSDSAPAQAHDDTYTI